ncbi:MAG: LamG domain-containing protein [Planctomycetaceae bacterium]
MTFTPDADFNGSVTLNMTTSLGANLEGHYTFEGGNAIDQSVGISQNGTFVGNATTVVDPTRGDVLSLDGAGDYVQISGTFGNPTNVTLAARVQTSGTTDRDVISLGDNVVLRIGVLNDLVAAIHNGSGWNTLFTGVQITSDWNHVAMTFDDASDTLSVYLNGTLVSTLSTANSIVYSQGANTLIGAHGNGSTSFDFNGMIDDARIYSRALTADEIAALATDQTESSDSVAITVNAVNDAPTNSFVSGGFDDSIQVNTTIAGNQYNARSTALSGGGHVVTWQSFDQDGNLWGVYAQRYDSSGAAVGSETLINSTTTDNQWEPNIAALSDGGYVIVWESNLQDTDGLGVFGQRFDADGIAAGSEFAVNTTTANDQKDPAVTGLPGGGFVVTWQSNLQDGSQYGIYARLLTRLAISLAVKR